VRCHLGLRVPPQAERCWIRVDGEICRWQEGRCLLFDDTYEHEVLNDTGDFYRFFDATPHAEFLYACVQRTIEHDLPYETQFLRRYDEFRRRIDSMIDMSDRTVDLLFRFLSQNDGTLMSAEFVEAYPVLTFASGPTTSMRGAASLAGLDNAMVADIGGTTTDFGWLEKGFPRESSVAVDIGGVRTNFRMPDVYAMGLGGGSFVEAGTTQAKIGPRSVGYRLLSEARVFGGETLTATDLAVAAGYVTIGDPGRVADLDPDLGSHAIDRIHEMVAEGVDRMKTSAEPVSLILVGGGAVLLNRPIAGTSDVIVPEHAGVANAIGASIAQVGGETDRVFSYDGTSRDQALADAVAEAEERALQAGAAPGTLKTIDLEELPLAYVPGNAVRVKVKVAGELALAATSGSRFGGAA